MAFPIPDYAVEDRYEPSEQGFDDFRLWIDGASAAYLTETRAILKDNDYSEALAKMHIDIASFGHMSDLDNYPEIRRLPAKEHKQLEILGLLDQGDDYPRWHVRKKYHWQQTFPARKTVHIRHEYTPVLGSNNGFRYAFNSPPDSLTANNLASFCLDEPMRSKLESLQDRDGGYEYVDFILTTANTWKTPIEDFTLIVERPHSKNNRGESEINYVSFCWDGPVTKTDADHFSAHTVNLVPDKELRIGFLSVEPASSEQNGHR